MSEREARTVAGRNAIDREQRGGRIFPSDVFAIESELDTPDQRVASTSIDGVSGTGLEAAGRCRCTIHEDRDQPCGYTGPLSDYDDPTILVCDTCWRVCWGRELDTLDMAWIEAEAALPERGWITVAGNANLGYNVTALVHPPYSSMMVDLIEVAKAPAGPLVDALRALRTALAKDGEEGGGG